MNAAPAHAQSAAISISIPAQPLSQALLELANRYSLDLAYSPEIVKGLYAPAVSGSLTADQALGQLLANTNIRYQRRGKNVSLTALAPNADSQVTQLAPVTVTGSLNGLTPAYAGGQLATGSRVGMLGNKDFMETPFSTKAYTRESIENSPSGNLLKVISDSDPSVSTTGSDYDLSNYASVHIRGFSTAGFEDLGINGLYGLASYGNRSLGDFAERVEIFKGPSALLNGMMPSGSVAGTVNTVTKRATDEAINRVTLGYESDSIYSGKVDFGRRFGADNEWGIRINASKRKGETAVKHKKVDNEAVGLGLDYRGSRLRVGLDWIHNEENTDGVSAQITSRLSAVPAPPTHDKLIAGEPWSIYNTKGNLFMLKGEYDLSDDTTVWASVGHNDRKMTANVMNWRLLNENGDFARDSVLVWNSKFKNLAADIGAQTKFETGPISHQLSVNANASERTVYQVRANYPIAGLPGGNIYDPTYVSKPTDVDYSPSIPKSNENTLQSIGVADTLSMLDDRLQLTVGVRQQRVKQKTFDPITGQVKGDVYDESATTPAVAALFKLTDQVSVYGNYIEGLSAGAQAPVSAANAGEMFAPYKSRQKELGVKYDAGSFATTLAVFEITRPSAVTNADNIYSFDGEQRNRGVEWEVFGEPMKGLRLIGGLSWKQAKLTKTQSGLYQGNDAPEVPRFEAKLGVAYDVPQINGLTLTANAIHTGKQYLDQANVQSIPSWRRYDLGFAYATRIASTPVTFRGTVYNVANSHYWYGVLWRGVSQPRTFNLSATFEF